MSDFSLEKKNILRSGVINTAHGKLLTPFFMPDATRAFLKGLSGEEAIRTGSEAMVVNTFHLYLQPGAELVLKAGGVHSFMNWAHPLLSDSGGYQVFSLIHRGKKMGKIDDDKASFKSPLDGSWHELSPEKSIQIQFDLGVDMMVVLDECPPNEWPRADLERAVERSLDWAKRSQAEYKRQLKIRKISEDKRPLLFAVVQGGEHEDLRKYSAQALVEIGFDGYGFGARPVDSEGNFLADILYQTASFLPQDSIRFALGVGSPEDIYRSYLMGWDIFDCVIPTREGRHGRLFVFNPGFESLPLPQKIDGAVDDFPDFYRAENINNSVFAKDFSPINPSSDLPELRNNSKAFLHHLFRLKDPLGQRLASLNNLEFYNQLIGKLRNLSASL